MNLYATAVSAAFTLIFGGATVLLALETYLLASGRPPITWHVREQIAHYPSVAFMVAALAAFVFGALFAHFFWSGGGGGY